MKNKQAKHNRKTLRKHHKEIHLSELEHLRVSDKLLREQNGHLRILCRTQMIKLDEMDARCAAVSLELISPEQVKFELAYKRLMFKITHYKWIKGSVNKEYSLEPVPANKDALIFNILEGDE